VQLSREEQPLLLDQQTASLPDLPGHSRPPPGEADDVKSECSEAKSGCGEAGGGRGRGKEVDLTTAGISNIENLLQSLTRKQVGEGEVEDTGDSARAESVASSSSSRSRVEAGAELSLVRRQSVIIEGLTLETDELRRRCQLLEDEVQTPVVEELHHKLGQMEGKLEETETYCYQVVEENVELKSEIENLESEITEVQDSFRDKDAKEFKKVKWELENLSKTCRNLQLKLGKAQARASRLRQEKEEMEEVTREQQLWKTTAVVAAAALAVYHILNKYR